MRRQLVMATLGGGAAGLVVALLLQRVIANTPVVIPADRQFWQTLLLSLAGAVAGLALTSVVNLQRRSGEQAYRHAGSKRGRSTEATGGRAREI